MFQRQTLINAQTHPCQLGKSSVFSKLIISFANVGNLCPDQMSGCHPQSLLESPWRLQLIRGLEDFAPYFLPCVVPSIPMTFLMLLWMTTLKA